MRFFTMREAAEQLRISPRHLHMLVRRGDLAVIHAGRRRLVSEDALQRFAREHERRGGGSGPSDPPEAA